MVLPNPLRRQLAYYAQPLGGLAYLERNLEEDKLRDLALHNDIVLLLNANLPLFKESNESRDPIRLDPYGQMPGSSIIVYDDNNNYLYRRFVQSGFGESWIDREVVRQTSQGRYLQIMFPSPTPRRLLFWVYRRPVKEDISRQIYQVRKQKNQSKPSVKNEVVFSFDQSVMSNGSPVKLYYLEGKQGSLTSDTLISTAEEKDQVLTSQPNDSVYLLPQTSLWIYAEQDGTRLDLPEDKSSHLSGISGERVRFREDGVFTINLERKPGKKVTAKQKVTSTNLGKSQNEPVKAHIILRRSD